MKNPKTGKAYLHHKPSKPLAAEKDRYLKPNSDIVAENYELIRTCVTYQISKSRSPEAIFDDVVQDVAMILLATDNEKLNRIYWENHLNAWISAILSRQLFSVRSKIWKDYREFSYLTKKEINEYLNDEEEKTDEE